MASIYTDEWYQGILELANSRQDLAEKIPKGDWNVAVELVGDSISPYIPDGSVKNWYIKLINGKMIEFREEADKISGKGLQYRFSGPAHIFEGVAAGVVDPVEVGLNGTLTVKGDMRLLMQYAELTLVIFEVYSQNNITEWPNGIPPYN